MRRQYSWFFYLIAIGGLHAQGFDVVLSQGRVIDPESGLDAVRNIGINGKRIVAISSTPLRGRTEVDVHGLVVSPGFIDLHSHGQDDENYHYKAHDGVTTALELEIGVSPVAEWYQSREGKAFVNFGAPPMKKRFPSSILSAAAWMTAGSASDSESPTFLPHRGRKFIASFNWLRKGVYRCSCICVAGLPTNPTAERFLLCKK
jgi:hypothetical protein